MTILLIVTGISLTRLNACRTLVRTGTKMLSKSGMALKVNFSVPSMLGMVIVDDLVIIESDGRYLYSILGRCEQASHINEDCQS